VSARSSSSQASAYPAFSLALPLLLYTYLNCFAFDVKGDIKDAEVVEDKEKNDILDKDRKDGGTRPCWVREPFMPAWNVINGR